jgi:hypothetical protein
VRGEKERERESERERKRGTREGEEVNCLGYKQNIFSKQPHREPRIQKLCQRQIAAQAS